MKGRLGLRAAFCMLSRSRAVGVPGFAVKLIAVELRSRGLSDLAHFLTSRTSSHGVFRGGLGAKFSVNTRTEAPIRKHICKAMTPKTKARTPVIKPSVCPTK